MCLGGLCNHVALNGNVTCILTKNLVDRQSTQISKHGHYIFVRGVYGVVCICIGFCSLGIKHQEFNSSKLFLSWRQHITFIQTLNCYQDNLCMAC